MFVNVCVIVCVCVRARMWCLVVLCARPVDWLDVCLFDVDDVVADVVDVCVDGDSDCVVVVVVVGCVVVVGWVVVVVGDLGLSL